MPRLASAAQRRAPVARPNAAATAVRRDWATEMRVSMTKAGPGLIAAIRCTLAKPRRARRWDIDAPLLARSVEENPDGEVVREILEAMLGMCGGEDVELVLIVRRLRIMALRRIEADLDIGLAQNLGRTPAFWDRQRPRRRNGQDGLGHGTAR